MYAGRDRGEVVEKREIKPPVRDRFVGTANPARSLIIVHLGGVDVKYLIFVMHIIHVD